MVNVLMSVFKWIDKIVFFAESCILAGKHCKSAGSPRVKVGPVSTKCQPSRTIDS